MSKKIDAFEMMALSHRIPESGLLISDPETIVYPVKLTGRNYNYSEDKRWFVFSTGNSTFICPFFFGIEKLLMDAGFKKSSIISVNFGPSMHPRYRLDMISWIHSCNVLFQYNADEARDSIRSSATVKKLQPFPCNIAEGIKEIPAVGCYLNGPGEKFYPMASTKFPHADYEKLGKFACKQLDEMYTNMLVYAADGLTYICKVKLSQPIMESMSEKGYIYDETLFVPSFDEV